MFHYGDNQLVSIPNGSYEIKYVLDSLEKSLNKEKEGEKIIEFRENHNTFKVEILCKFDVHFDKANSIGRMLGFSAKKLIANKWHMSDTHVDVFEVRTLSVLCNVTGQSWHNGAPSHCIFQTSLDVPPGYKLSIQNENLIYYPIMVRSLHEIEFKIVDQNQKLVSFGHEAVTLSVHIRQRKNA